MDQRSKWLPVAPPTGNGPVYYAMPVAASPGYRRVEFIPRALRVSRPTRSYFIFEPAFESKTQIPTLPITSSCGAARPNKNLVLQ